MGFRKGTALEVAKKLDIAADFGWRSASALR
jgi:hypothetical protein